MLEEWIDEAHRLGYTVNNLFERSDLRWQCNLLREDEYTDFGLGDTPAEAIEEALSAMAHKLPKPTGVVGVIESTNRPSIMSLLNLPAIKRRI